MSIKRFTPPARPRTAVWGCIIEGRTVTYTDIDRHIYG